MSLRDDTRDRPPEHMITWGEVSAVLRTLRRWWAICVLAVSLAAGTAFYLTAGETRYYVARTTLMVGNTLSSARPDQYQISIGSSLAQFYAELARRGKILGQVQARLGLPFPWELISDRMLTTNVVPSANMLEIYVTDSDPQRAAAIADAIGEELVNFSPTSPEKIEAEQAAVEQQLTDGQGRINGIKGKIEELTARQRQATSASDLAEINETLSELNSSLEREQAAYSALLGYKTNSVVNSLSFFEHAVPPGQPLPSKRLLVVGVAGLAGLLLSFVGVFLLEQIDSSVQRRGEVQDRLKLGELGHVPSGPPLLIAPQGFVDERLRAVREVQTNIMLASGGVRTLVVTSAEASDARTAFSVDLADLFGRAGHRVLLVDADHASSLLSRILAPEGAAQVWPAPAGQGGLWAHLQATQLANVALLPRRHSAAGDPALISSQRWRELVGQLRDAADVVIFDGPDTLSGPDAALLAPHVDGVVLTVDPGQDGRAAVARSKERLLTQPGAHLLGAVIFTPAGQAPSGVWRWLEDGGPHILPPIQDGAASDVRHGPIVTPPPDDYARVIVTPAPQGRAPIITPAPANGVWHDAAGGDDSGSAGAQPPVAGRRQSPRRGLRPRKAARQAQAHRAGGPDGAADA